MRKAMWDFEYDHKTDKMYKSVNCPRCHEDTLKSVGGNTAECFLCDGEFEIDDDQRGWLLKYKKVHREIESCPKCGNRSLIRNYRINPVDESENTLSMFFPCGIKVIV